MPAAALAVALCAMSLSVVPCRPEPVFCNVRVRTESGVVCGVTRLAEDNTVYASFRGVPYAKQPVGELRFKELQPIEPWDHLFDATREGPVCPQYDIFYGNLAQERTMSEACIHANIHVPIEALPLNRPVFDSQSPYGPVASYFESDEINNTGLPILVFIHGGGFAFGSGDSDLHGPEYLVSKGVIVITFNYRLNVFGFLSLGGGSVPGNAGLRDAVTLLRWVRRNARSFGGDPARVTLAGQSAGAAAAHLLTLSNAADGLYQRVILMSGTGIPSFYTTSPYFAQYVSRQLLAIIGINSTDPEEIHNQLIEVPLEKIMTANKLLQNQLGISVFMPVVESPLSEETTILDEDPEVLLKKGRGKNVPLIIGHTDAECESFRPLFERLDILTRVKQNPTLLVLPKLTTSLPPEVVLAIAKRVESRYFNGSLTMDNYLKLCSDAYFIYPTLKLAQIRAAQDGAPVYQYKFSYSADSSVFTKAFGIKYEGAAHIEDLTYIFRTNSVLGSHRSFPPHTKDDLMKYWMTSRVVDYMCCSSPTCNSSAWPPVNQESLQYLDIKTPLYHKMSELNQNEMDMLAFFDDITKKS